MNRKLVVLSTVAILCLVAIPHVYGQTTPALLPEIASVEIVGCIFVKEYSAEGFTVRVSGDDMDKYRIAILTLCIQKPAGTELKLAVADVTLHYYYGSKEEVAPCDGISTFSNVLDVDRAFKTTQCSPGWLKQTTGTRTTTAAKIYVDVAFRQVEPDISKLWVCFAKPATERFSTTGWKP